MQEQAGFFFGPFRLDVRDERLWRGQDVLPLRHKTLGVLHALVARAGQLLTKEALFASVWPETAVSETVLTVAIRELRRVLGDQARCPQFIETVHGRGYRFIAPVAVVEPSPEQSQTEGWDTRLRRVVSPVRRTLSGARANWPSCSSGSPWHARAGGRWCSLRAPQG